MPPVRKSGRRQTRVSYTEDTFEAIGLDDDISDSERRMLRDVEEAEVSDEEFRVDEDDEAGKSADEEIENESVAGSETETASVRPPTVETGSIKPKRVRPKPPTDYDAALDPQATHSRGLPKTQVRRARTLNLEGTFGSSNSDLLPLVLTRVHWANGRDSTFPSRETLEGLLDCSSDRIGDMLGVSGDQLRMEATKGWDWFYENGAGDPHVARQHVVKISEEDAQKYLPKPKATKSTVLIGPTISQKAFKVGRGECFDFGGAWIEAKPEQQSKPKGTSNDAASAAQTSTSVQKTREGWIVNVGNKIQTAAWAPNNVGNSQYLAVSVPVTETQKADVKRTDSLGAPAFTPSPPYPCAIQIWSFEATSGNGVRGLDMGVKPRLRLVMGTDAGDIRTIAWCPMGRERRDANEKEDVCNVGLLAGVWGDGTLRVLDVRLNKNMHETEYVRIDSAAFELRPPSTLCTSFAWLSPSDIAFGCANGFVGLWSFLNAGNETSPTSSKPSLYFPVHNTYVLAVASAYPAHPDVLSTAGMDGQTKMFSLLDPQKDMAESQRVRIGTGKLSYLPFFRSFACADDNDFIRLMPIRRYFTMLTVLKSSGTLSAVSQTNFCHPSILVGNSAGVATATTPLKRLLDAKAPHFQQNWFDHEWVRGTDKSHYGDDAEAAGTSRFFDGFKAEQINLSRGVTDDTRWIDGVQAATVHEEGTAVTALAWNPNRHCAGWACAGTGCGLLRVEDLAV